MRMHNKLLAEFIGTFWLVLGGCGSAMLAATFGNADGINIGLVGVSLAFGLTVLTMAYTVGGISGGHFNPAVSIGLVVGGRFSAAEVVPYIISQVLGAIAAAAGVLVARADTYLVCRCLSMEPHVFLSMYRCKYVYML